MVRSGAVLVVLFTVLLSMFHVAAEAASFNYSSYAQISLHEIEDKIKEVANEDVGIKGFALFYESYALKIRLSAYPKSSDAYIENRLDLCWKVTKVLKPEFRALFTNKRLDIEDRGYNFTLVFQDTLVPYLEKEIKLGEEITVYAVLVMYDEWHKRTILLVNEFEKVR